MDKRDIVQLAMLIVIPGGAAVLGLIIGRLLRGPRQTREAKAQRAWTQFTNWRAQRHARRRKNREDKRK
jgi:hypothetical protein